MADAGPAAWLVGGSAPFGDLPSAAAPVAALPAAVGAASGRTTFEVVLLAALGLALLGVLLAVVLAIVETRGRDRRFAAERERRGERVSQARRLEAEYLRAEELNAQVAALTELFDAPARAGDLDGEELRVDAPERVTASAGAGANGHGDEGI